MENQPVENGTPVSEHKRPLSSASKFTPVRRQPISIAPLGNITAEYLRSSFQGRIEFMACAKPKTKKPATKKKK
jgi:hypothetical protein